jgi:hypothetical protein
MAGCVLVIYIRNLGRGDAHLVARGGEMRGYFFVDGVDVFSFVGCALVSHYGSDAWEWREGFWDQ